MIHPHNRYICKVCGYEFAPDLQECPLGAAVATFHLDVGIRMSGAGMLLLELWLLNLGIGLVALQPYVHAGWLTFAGRSMKVTAVIGFGVGAWTRIKPHGR